MKRIMLSTIGTAALALALPGAALASHSHERVHHHHHQKVHRKQVHRKLKIKQIRASSSTTPVSAQSAAGTVTSFVGGVLTLTLNNGSTVSGTVTSATAIECEMAPPAPVANAADHGDGGRGNHGGEDRSGPGPGDNQGNHDQNDNDGNDDGNDNNGDQNDDRNEAPCDTSVLVPGAVVHEAELRIDSTGARFTSVEISR